jgi:hypothetical protein
MSGPVTQSSFLARPNNQRKEGCDFLEQIQLAHLVRVGVSWKTADSSRVSALIAEQSLSRSLPYQILPERGMQA